MRAWKQALIGAAALAAAPAAFADPALDPYVMFGFNRYSGNLYRYDFADSHLSNIGTVRLGNTEVRNVNAAAYIPGYQNIFAFWTDTSVSKVKLLYVNTLTAQAAEVASEMEGGAITGATSALTANGWEVFGIQLSKISPPFTISGSININPNNSPQNEFVLTKEDGTQITRDDLHQNAPVGGGGVLFEGSATFIHVKPKGNGNQNTLLIDGQPFILTNANTYDFSGNMVVRLYNDQIHSNGKAMGKWWITISAGTASSGENVAVGTPDRLIKIDHKTGAVIELDSISREYNGLATTDGVNFYATYGDKLYHLYYNGVEVIETLVGTLAKPYQLGLEFAGPNLYGFEVIHDNLVPVNPADATVGTSMNLGAQELGTIVFTPASSVPAWSTLGCD